MAHRLAAVSQTPQRFKSRKRSGKKCYRVTTVTFVIAVVGAFLVRPTASPRGQVFVWNTSHVSVGAGALVRPTASPHGQVFVWNTSHASVGRTALPSASPPNMVENNISVSLSDNNRGGFLHFTSLTATLFASVEMTLNSGKCNAC